MALRKTTLAQRMVNAYKICRPSLTTCRICSANSITPRSNPEHDPGDNGVFRRVLHRNSMYRSLATSPELRSLPAGEKLIEKLRGMDIARNNRIRLDGLVPPVVAEEGKLTVDVARKVLRLAQVEAVKLKICEVDKDWISYSEFIDICNIGGSLNVDQAVEFASMLDQSGTVIVLGNIVFLKPHQESLSQDP